MRNVRVCVIVATAMSLLAVLAVPIGRNAAIAQNWEVASPYGTLVAFDRRDDQGLIYYHARMNAQEMPGKYYAADCSKGLAYSYDYGYERERKWQKPYDVTDIPTRSTIALAYKYVCEKYGR